MTAGEWNSQRTAEDSRCSLTPQIASSLLPINTEWAYECAITVYLFPDLERR